jgi:hypothetical protein
MILGALIQHWLCYRRYPESRCITLFQAAPLASKESAEVAPTGTNRGENDEIEHRQDFIRRPFDDPAAELNQTDSSLERG